MIPASSNSWIKFSQTTRLGVLLPKAILLILISYDDNKINYFIIIIIICNRMVNPRAPVLSCRASLARNLAGFSLASGNKKDNKKKYKKVWNAHLWSKNCMKTFDKLSILLSLILENFVNLKVLEHKNFWCCPKFAKLYLY